MTRMLRSLGAILLALFGATGDPTDGYAACNVFPGTSLAYGSALGAANRPFAAPGESVELRLRPCDTASAGFLPNGSDHVVTIAFKPPGGGTARLVVLSTDCGPVDTSSCSPTLTTCHAVPASALATVTNRDLGDRRLVFAFPDTDTEFAPAADGLTLSGPAAIAVTAVGDPLPCGLATTACAGLSGTLACVDALALDDGACGTTVPNDVFSHFTALPRPNDFQADCFRADPPCTAAATAIRMAEDASGNLLIPVNWQGVLVSDAGVPVPRLLRTRIKSPVPFELPDQVFLGSFSPEAGRLP